MYSASSYIGLGPQCSLKRLECNYLYRSDTDDLYELGEDAAEFLGRCDGSQTAQQLGGEPAFLEYCLAEGLLVAADAPAPVTVRIGAGEAPSLRYLVADVTNRCNLACQHCYLGAARPLDLDIGLLEHAMTEFEEMGGLRLVVSGGEPLCAPAFWEINEMVRGRAFRSILSTNGLLVDADVARRLAFHNVQVSLDGMGPGHDRLRGEGSFNAAVQAMESLAEAGVGLSVATMVHAANLDQFDEMAALVNRFAAMSWTIDVPAVAGRLAKHPELVADLDRAVACLDYQFGGEMHGASGEYACGAHLGSILVDGTLAKCGFYDDWTGGHVSCGLRACWQRLPRVCLSELSCDCPVLSECRGGCRFRAEAATGDRYAPDVVRCHACNSEPSTGYMSPIQPEASH